MDSSVSNAMQLLYNLNERAKELQCNYEVDSILKESTLSDDDKFFFLCEAIPNGWQFPDICCVYISINGKEYYSKNFIRSEWKLSKDILVDKEIKGYIEIYYKRYLDSFKNEVFLIEEEKLINSISEKISVYLFNKKLRFLLEEWTEAEKAINSVMNMDERLIKIISNTDIEKLLEYISSAHQNLQTSEEVEQFLSLKSEKHWKWRYKMVSVITKKLIDKNNAYDKYGIVNLYLIGSTKNANAGPASDIDLLVHFKGDDIKKRSLVSWFEGWSHCLSEMNFEKTGYLTEGLIDLHIITDDDIKNKDSFAMKIGAVTDGARLINLT